MLGKAVIIFCTPHHDLGCTAICRDVKSLCGFLRIRISWFFFTVELRKVMDIKLAIGDVFDNLLVDPGPAGENIDGCAEGIRRITWVWFRIRWGSWSAVCLFKRIEPVHELCERVLDSLTEFSLVFF